VHDIRTKTADSEKITINLGYVDLGYIDLMVKDESHSNRTDFIRTAIRNQLDRHAEVVRQSVARKTSTSVLRTTAAATLRRCKSAARCCASVSRDGG
jgi:Arc/MetJ-type ribon-helix-helix transcriptional regulator